MSSVRSFRARGPWVKYSRTPCVMKRASELGEYNHEVLGALGLSPEEIDALEEKWAAKKQTL